MHWRADRAAVRGEGPRRSLQGRGLAVGQGGQIRDGATLSCRGRSENDNRRILSLWRRTLRDPNAAGIADRLQLFHMPSLRHVMGLLFAQSGTNRAAERRDRYLHLGRSINLISPLQDLRLRHPLGCSRSAVRPHGRQRKAHGAGNFETAAYSQARWCRHGQIFSLNQRRCRR
jgi:hypothetical protein